MNNMEDAKISMLCFPCNIPVANRVDPMKSIGSQTSGNYDASAEELE